jgi:integrase
MRITTTWLESRQVPKGRPKTRTEVNVDGRDGLVVRLHPTGVITFRFRYQRDGKRRWLVLGKFGDGGLTLAEAQDRHNRALQELEKGLDPIEEDRKRDEAERQAREERAGAGTIADLIAQFVHRRLRGERLDKESGQWVRDEKSKTKPRKRPDEAARILGYQLPGRVLRPAKGKKKAKATFVSALGHFKGPEVTKRQIVSFLDDVVDRGAPIAANRIYSLLKQFFEWAAAKDLIPASPMAGVERPGGEEHSRTRALSDDEIRAFWSKLDACDIREPTRLALKLLLVTGQRRGELTAAAWSHFDLEKKLWTIPVELQKTSHARTVVQGPHVVPLSPLALDLLGQLKALTGEGRYVLPSRGNPKSQRPYSVGALTHAITDNRNVFGIPAFAPHDLRRTLRTGLSRLKVEPHIAERVINHAQDKIVATYDMYAFVDEKRQAVDKWAQELNKILAAKPEAVTETPRKPRP